ncbi:type II toxin-antitoxin system VapC family toxin [Spirosoma linguale]|uniref:PIN domain-containing protein n=1 Tax=Spirosoma linguale (strain ATCC 33905 / DSM 74 / LMG 10896 / Claus 1) TaxID=504472 RepID=D2QS94_SPILD|nr:hypothetical protein Slin_5711 [Spirosoma linguale DSM 74]
MPRSVLLDTSFFLRFLNDENPLYANADGYFRHFLREEMTMFISTISIAEYCVGGDISELPLKNLQILPFNVSHARRTGEFARLVFRHRNKLDLVNRMIIPNDTKLFAQADIETNVFYYLSSDAESQKVYGLLRTLNAGPKFDFLNLNVPPSEAFGLLDLR